MQDRVTQLRTELRTLRRGKRTSKKSRVIALIEQNIGKILRNEADLAAALKRPKRKPKLDVGAAFERPANLKAKAERKRKTFRAK
jgi:hypothetical protein